LPFAKAFPQLWTLVLDGSLNFVAAVIILIAGWTFAGWTAKWLRAAVNRIPYVDRTLRPLIASTARYTIIIFTIVAVLERFGVQTTSIIAMLGAAGLAIGLAIQGTLSNVASGVMLLVLRSMRAGEEVTTSGYSGVIREVGLFRTVLITGDGLYISIPNATIFSNPIVNNSREPTRQINFKVVIDHAADIGAAQSAALSVLHADKRVLKNPPPAAPVVDLGEQNVACGDGHPGLGPHRHLWRRHGGIAETRLGTPAQHRHRAASRAGNRAGAGRTRRREAAPAHRLTAVRSSRTSRFRSCRRCGTSCPAHAGN